jgi:hypothetical protein
MVRALNLIGLKQLNYEKINNRVVSLLFQFGGDGADGQYQGQWQ